MMGDSEKPAIVDAHGRPARQALEPVRCPRCRRECPKGDLTKRERSGGFGGDVHDVCGGVGGCGYDFVGELTV